MSACISSRGEFGSHNVPVGESYCEDCGLPDEGASTGRNDAIRSLVESAKATGKAERTIAELRAELREAVLLKNSLLSDVARERATVARVLDAIRLCDLSDDDRGRLLAAVYINPDQSLTPADVARGQEIWATLKGTP